MMSASHTPEETKTALHEVVAEMYDKIANERLVFPRHFQVPFRSPFS